MSNRSVSVENTKATNSDEGVVQVSYSERKFSAGTVSDLLLAGNSLIAIRYIDELDVDLLYLTVA